MDTDAEISDLRFICVNLCESVVPPCSCTGKMPVLQHEIRTMQDMLHKLRRGFTLVELLVVLGIIALLISILLPSLTIARESARTVQCLSNLRQMVTAANIYVSDNGGHYPSAYFGYSKPPFSYSYSWDFTVITSLKTGKRSVQPGLLWQGRADARIQQCPSFDGKSNTVADPHTGYNYNTSYIGHGQLEALKSPAKACQVSAPTTCALFGDGQFKTGANKYMRAPQPNPGDANFSSRTAGTQGFRHRKMTNVAFADGHAESLAECFSAGMAVAPGTGFLSEDNSLYRPN
jgi:prepilin-type N-terminal cleavage/methylation domain-containing protein/prepilin-type processing-associated H-X9-DG protein